MAFADFPLNKVKLFLKHQKCDEFGERNGKSIWIAKDGITIIQLPLKGSIPFVVLHSIATDQLQMSEWEFDYWVGQNC